MRSMTVEDVNLRFEPKPILPLINKLSGQEPAPYLHYEQSTYLQLVHNNGSNKQYQDIMKMLQHPFIYCYICPDSIIGNKTEFKFKFNLYINDSTSQNQHCQDANVYKYIFTTTYKDIKAIYSKATKKRKYFPVQKFPTC